MEGSSDSVEAARASIFQGDLPLGEKLERARTELLDLSARNRLLSVPRSSKAAKTVEVVGARAVDVFQTLVRDDRPMTFVPGKAEDEEEDGLKKEAKQVGESEGTEVAVLMADSVEDARDAADPRSAKRLQTRMTPKGLQKRLMDLHLDARTLEEEQGTNILFLVLGTLKWTDPGSASNARHAPLILIPVRLERAAAGQRFKLRHRPEDMAPNLSLEAYLDRVHALRMPEADFGDDFDPAAYLAAVAEAVSSKAAAGWEVVTDDVILGFFSFSKFLMYRDLDPAAWPADGALTDQPLIRGLLADGFAATSPGISEDESIDPHIPPADMLHIVDCDSSQALAVHDVRSGRDLVIQGPPGTGKSQTIANVIAAAIADGKTVLFVAEKMTALEVVKRRLDGAGVGEACLELHSNKANKRGLLEELRRTWDLGAPKGDDGSALNDRLLSARDALNGHVDRMHKRHPAAALTPFEVVGHLTRLRAAGRVPTDLALEAPETWTAGQRQQREELVRDLARRVEEIGPPALHPWRGVGLDFVLPTDLERTLARAASLATRLAALAASQAALAGGLGLEAPARRSDLDPMAALARRLSGTPTLPGHALGADVWASRPQDVKRLLWAGSMHAKLRRLLDGVVAPLAWDADLEEARASLAGIPPTLTQAALDRAGQLATLLPRLTAEADGLREHLGLTADVSSAKAVADAINTADRVAAAPDASPSAFEAAVWDRGVDQAGDLAEAVARLERTRAALAGVVTEAAWGMDLQSARQTLASHGTGMLKSLSGEWRRANALVRSVLAKPEMALTEVLSALDALAEGRAAATAIRDGDAFGRAAFGEDWRGERTSAAPLQALVAWMGSLRGLGAEPRLIAGRLPDRSRIADRAASVGRLLDGARPLLAALWADLEGDAVGTFGGAPSPELVPLLAVARWSVRASSAAAACSAAFLQMPDDAASKVSRLDQVMAGQKAAGMVREGGDLGATAFGPAWRGIESDWVRLDGAADWLGDNGDLRLLAAGLADPREHAARVDAVVVEADAFGRDLATLFGSLRTDLDTLFSAKDWGEVPYADLAERLATWLAHGEDLSKWVAFRERAVRGRASGVGEVMAALEVGRLAPDDAVAAFDMAYYEALFGDQVRDAPEIARFDGLFHDGLRREFAALDNQRIASAQLEVARAHHRRIPPPGGGAGPLGVLRSEIVRRRGHMPIRQLMMRAGPVIQALKPVMMMSPLSVAQFLPPGRLKFDLLVMDEASQIQPVDALGAIARCGKVVVVGDERQLPPTRFFSRVTGGQEAEDEDGAQVADIESILGLFTARGLPQRMLRWHYRSRHQSLIAVSNTQFYQNRLFIVPSPYTAEAGMGLLFHHVPNGVFDSGGTSVNAVEAEVVARAVLRHAKEHPGESLGVATFSAAQRRAIVDKLDDLQRVAGTDPFFEAHPAEPFFVKSLEAVQGDERDVILISVGYGRNAQGTMAMRFGPLGAEGGERRLNVLISRAKRRCEVYASITDEDIVLERAKGKGVFAFKLFLHFARTGRLSMAVTSGRDFDSPFEVQVANALQERGMQVHAQVGIAGFFIDLALADPDRPGRYVLGVECDGASYHSSRSARDRDRLRQAVLEDHGWIIHRIWSTDWFQRPQEQLDKVVAAYEAAKRELDARLETAEARARAVPLEVVTIDRVDVTEVGLSEVPEAARSNTYVEALAERAPGWAELHEVPADQLARSIVKVVEVEGPVHIDEVVVRLKAAWGISRAGARIQAAVDRAVALATRAGTVAAADRILAIPGAEVRARDRAAAASPSLRKPEMLPPVEVDVAVVEAARRNFGGTADELLQEGARALGFRTVGGQLREVMRARIAALEEDGRLVRSGELLVVPDAAPSSSLAPSRETGAATMH